MFNPWLELSLKAVHMGMEAQNVIALRMLRLATGGARTEADASRMVTNEVAAAETRAVAAVSALNIPSPKRVRSNKRRRSRH
jgi:hypothetical protein